MGRAGMTGARCVACGRVIPQAEPNTVLNLHGWWHLACHRLWLSTEKGASMADDEGEVVPPAAGDELTSDDIPGPLDVAEARRKLDASLDELRGAAEEVVNRYSELASEPPHVVTRYSVTREYGGPEEGGWWYDHWDCPKEVLGRCPPSVAQAAARLLNDLTRELRKARREPDRYSVNGSADEEYVAEERPGSRTTTERPHYE